MVSHKEPRHTESGPTCALTPTALTDRLSNWRTLTDQALSRKTEPGRVVSTYPRSVLSTLQTLIEAEAECCPFLTFHVQNQGEFLRVELRYPPEFEPMLATVIGDSHTARAQ